MTLRNLHTRLARLEAVSGHGHPGRQPWWDSAGVVPSYRQLTHWLLERGLLLAEAVAQGEAGPPGLPFTLAEALEIERRAVRPDEPGYNPRDLDPWKNPEDVPRCWVEMVRCGGWVRAAAIQVLAARLGQDHRE